MVDKCRCFGSGVQWEKLRLEAEAAALKECTFAPKAVANNRRHLAGYVPIQDRLGELQRRKRCACAVLMLQFSCRRSVQTLHEFQRKFHKHSRLAHVSGEFQQPHPSR